MAEWVDKVAVSLESFRLSTSYVGNITVQVKPSKSTSPLSAKQPRPITQTKPSELPQWQQFLAQTLATGATEYSAVNHEVQRIKGTAKNSFYGQLLNLQHLMNTFSMKVQLVGKLSETLSQVLAKFQQQG